MSITITVYTKTKCVQCDATKNKLAKLKLPYETIDAEHSQDARDFLWELKRYLQMPVVVIKDDDQIVDHWSGFRPSRLDDWATHMTLVKQ